MKELECYVDESYEILINPESKKPDYASALEKLAIQYGETVALARCDLIHFPAKKVIRIMAILDLLKMKLSN